MRDPLGQPWQNARRALDQDDADVLVRIDLIEAVGDHLARALIELGGQFRASRAGADDGDMQLAGLNRLALGLGPEARVDQPMVKSHRLFRGLERNGEFRRSRRAEIVGHAADSDDQRVIGNAARRRDLSALLVISRAEPNGLARAVEPDHFAEVIAKMVPVALREIVQLVLGRVHAASGDDMQERLP